MKRFVDLDSIVVQLPEYRIETFVHGHPQFGRRFFGVHGFLESFEDQIALIFIAVFQTIQFDRQIRDIGMIAFQSFFYFFDFVFNGFLQ